MRTAKQVADAITLARGLIALGLVWLGLARPAQHLSMAVGLMILDWTGDNLDGAFARRAVRPTRTWIGDHDLEIDMLVSVGLLLYLVETGQVNLWLAVGYGLAWALAFWRLGIPRPLGMLFQAPIYAVFILLALIQAPVVGMWLVVWIAAAVAMTWPKFPREVVPGFIAGMRRAWRDARRRRH